MKARKRAGAPVEVFQLHEENWDMEETWPKWLRDAFLRGWLWRIKDRLYLNQPSGPVEVNKKDFIVKGIKIERYAQDVYYKLFEAVEKGG